MPGNAVRSDLAASFVDDVGDPPESSQVEISLFGPGYGECVVLHVGNGSWVIVDSCTHPDFDTPTPLHYLQSLGVDVSTQVKCVVVSHWHDDHVSGMSRVVAECKSARISCSVAYLKEEFMTVMEAYAQSNVPQKTGVDELRAVFDELESSKRHIRRAGAGTEIWHQSGGWNRDSFNCQIKALGPSDAMATASAKSIAELVCDQGPQCRAPSQKNLTSIVLWVSVGTDGFILGGDMPEKPHRGWTVILDEFEDALRDGFAYKVAHHGSKNSHHHNVWTHFLRSEPYALLAPFIGGATRLPGKSDVNRILDYTNNGFITAPPTLTGRRRKRTPPVERVMKEGMGNIREVIMTQGQVRIRMRPGQPDSIKVQLFNGALPLVDAWS